MSIFTPVNQIRLTNVVVVRYKKEGKRFELACYPNKVTAWRNKVEKNLDEVLQVHNVFLNVSKGIVAKREDLKLSFGNDNIDEVIPEILEHGELQVSEKERGEKFVNLFKDIVNVVAEKCVDPNTNRPITVGVIDRTLKEAHFAINPKRSAKQQALEAIRVLKTKIPIERAHMKLKILAPAKNSSKVKELIKPLLAKLEKEEFEGGFECICLIDPGNFRKIEEEVKTETKGFGSVEVISLAVHEEGDSKIESKTQKSAKQNVNNNNGEEGDEEEEEEGEEKTPAENEKPVPKAAPKKKGQAPPGVIESDDDNDEKPKGKKPRKAKAKPQPQAKRKGQELPTMLDEEDSEDSDEPTPKKAVVKGKQPIPKGKSAPIKDEEEEEEEDDEEPTPKKAVPKGKQPVIKGKAQPKGKSAPIEEDDDEDEEPTPKKAVSKGKKPVAKGKAQPKGKSEPIEEDDEEEDDEGIDLLTC